MKNKICIIYILVFTIQTIFSQQIRYWETNSQLYAKAMKSTLDGGFVVSGSVNIQNNFFAGFVFYSDSSGQNHWEKVYTSFDNTFSFETIEQFPDSRFIAGGKMYNPITAQLGGALLKLDQNGNEIWKKSIADGSGAEILISDLLIDSDSSFLIVAKKTENNDGSYVIKMDTSGYILWQKSFEMPGNDKIELNSLKQASDKSLYVVGKVISNNSQNGLIMRLDSLGNTVWIKKNTYSNSSFTDLLLDCDHLFCRNGTGFGEVIVSSLDLNGNAIWNLKFPEYEDLNFPYTPGKRKLIFDTDSNIVLYSSNFSFSTFHRFSRDGINIDGMYGFGTSQGIEFYPNGSCAILLSGPAYGVKSSLITDFHFAVTRLENFNSKLSSCMWPIMELGTTISDNTTDISLSTSSICTTSTAMMENVTAFISIDNNCVEFLGNIDEIAINNFEITPNPTKEMIEISMNSTGELPQKGYLVDALGNEVLIFKISSANEIIDVSPFGSGIYWVKIGDTTKKLILD